MGKGGRGVLTIDAVTQALLKLTAREGIIVWRGGVSRSRSRGVERKREMMHVSISDRHISYPGAPQKKVCSSYVKGGKGQDKKGNIQLDDECYCRLTTHRELDQGGRGQGLDRWGYALLRPSTPPDHTTLCAVGITVNLLTSAFSWFCIVR